MKIDFEYGAVLKVMNLLLGQPKVGDEPRNKPFYGAKMLVLASNYIKSGA